MRSKGTNKFVQIVRAPLRILCKARDFYIKGMLDLSSSGKVGYGSAGGGTTSLPKSFSVNSSTAMNDEELKKLVKMFSCKKNDGCGMKRSYSVGVGMIGRIDEERPCSFREDQNEEVANLYPRSRSHAVRRRV